MSVLSGERLVAARSALDVTQETLAAHSGISQGLISQWERDLKTPSEHSARKIQVTLAKLKMIQQRHPGVKIAMNDIRFIRKQLRELSRENPAQRIEQVWGSEFISRFCSYARLTVPEFLAMAQLRRTIGEAAVVSAPCQRWVAAWATGVEREIRSAGDALTFEDCAARFETRQAALEHLARTVFDRLIGEVGKEKIQEYQSRLLATGELRQAPKDTTEN